MFKASKKWESDEEKYILEQEKVVDTVRPGAFRHFFKECKIDMEKENSLWANSADPVLMASAQKAWQSSGYREVGPANILDILPLLGGEGI